MIFDTMNGIPVPRLGTDTGIVFCGRMRGLMPPSGMQRAYRAASAAA